MTYPSMSLAEQSRWVKPAWRVLVVLAIVQLIGMGVGFVHDLAGNTFLSVWYGGACASPIGYFCGLIWHVKVIPNGFAANRLVLLLLGAMVVALPILGWLSYDVWRSEFAR